MDHRPCFGVFLAGFLTLGMALCTVSEALAGGGGGRPMEATTVEASAATDHFVAAAACAPCHNDLRTADGQELSLVVEWQPSIMANAFVDPFWRAKVRTEMRRIPSLAGAIEAKCASCHAPMATTEAIKADEPVAVFASGFVDPDHPYHAIAVEGVGCTLCHQIQDTPELGTPAAASGHYSIADASASDGRRIYGQYAGPFPGPMVGSVDYLAVLGDHLHEAAVCATCHDLETDYVDASGNVVSTPDTRFPEQMPYTEWLHSDFGPDGDHYTTCQVCHMTTVGASRVARRPVWLPMRNDVSRHGFPSINTTILGILASFAGELGITGEGLEEAAEGGRDLLRTAGTVEVLDAFLEGGTLQFTVRVVNATGHKVPTGIPVRRVYLHATVRDPSGIVVFESGRLNDDHTILGADQDTDPLTFEPHYDVITAPDQVQLYETVLGSVEGDITYTLLRAAQFLKDNRIPPRGLEPATAPDPVRSVGACLDDADCVGGSDQVTYRVSGLAGGRYTVEVELRDQALAYPFVRDLQSDSDDPYVAGFARMFDASPASSEVIDAMAVDVRQ